MVKQVYMTLAALLILACAVSAAPRGMAIGKEHDFPASRQVEAVSDEDTDEVAAEEALFAAVAKRHVEAAAAAARESAEESDEDDDDEEASSRRRRDVDEKKEQQQSESEQEPSKVEAVETPAEEGVAVSTTTRKPVLVLIRDALKKVTTDLPTQQVATNALQYFQLFEHFIQQTIEQVISDDDDDEEAEAATALPGAEAVADKQPEKVETALEQSEIKPIEAAQPVEQMAPEAELAAAPAAVASNAV